MARIRSIHPGLFTDPEFASLSDAAQVFYLGLLTEADDNGVFDWNPSKLRIRLRPGKDGGVEKLLSELEAAGKVKKYEHDGRHLGAIRNFRKFQRPKSPKAVYFIPVDFRNYVGLSPPASENPPQREDGGGRMEEEFEPKGSHEPADPAREGERKPTDAMMAFDAWNDFAKAQGLRTADFATGPRLFAIETVLKVCGGCEAWAKGLKKAETAQFLRGRDGVYHGWFKLEWLLQEDRFVRLLEGQYDHVREVNGTAQNQHETYDQRRAREAREAVR